MTIMTEDWKISIGTKCLPIPIPGFGKKADTEL